MGTGADADTETDTGTSTDTGTDGETIVDTDTDTCRGEACLAPTDSDTDADTSAETTTDTPSDTVADAGSETEIVTVTDNPPDSGADTGSETDTPSETETPSDTATETGSETETATDTSSDTGTVVDTGSETPTETKSDPNQCCGSECTDCAQIGQVCNSGETACVLQSCVNDSDCPSKGYVCNEKWGYCVVSSCDEKGDFTPCEAATTPERSYDICVEGTCVSPGCGDVSCNVPGPYFPLADTNQRECYDGTSAIECPSTGDYYGQDAQYGWDVTHDPDERFTRDTTTSEPVVTDNVTALIWQGCSAGQTGMSCAESAVVALSWDQAVAYCDQLSWGGYADWRLPDIDALHSIVDAGWFNPAIDTIAFPATPSDFFWSSSSNPDNMTLAWYVTFLFGRVQVSDKTSAYFVRCVRGGS